MIYIYSVFQMHIFTLRWLIMLIYFLKYMRIRFEVKMFCLLCFSRIFQSSSLVVVVCANVETFPTQKHDEHEARFPSHIICARNAAKVMELAKLREKVFANNHKIW